MEPEVLGLGFRVSELWVTVKASPFRVQLSSDGTWYFLCRSISLETLCFFFIVSYTISFPNSTIIYYNMYIYIYNITEYNIIMINII